MKSDTKQVRAGKVAIGGGAPVTVQSMLSLPPEDVQANVRQAVALEEAGCDILRVAIPTRESVALIGAIKREIAIPLVADIHYDYRLALESAAAGVDKIRINPGNIGDADRVRQVANACAAKGIPIRIGVNSGSVEKSALAKYGGPTPEAMVESALYHASLLEAQDFGDIVLSIKSSDVAQMIAAYRLMSTSCEYPLHLGVTHAGTSRIGLLKSAVGIGGLLLDGIGSTLRVSLTEDPVREVAAGRDILEAIGMGTGIHIFSCPTCGRCGVDLISMTQQVEQALEGCELPITVAVMGCVVNGPGEAREADLAVCGGKGAGVLFAGDRMLGRYPEEELIPALLEQVRILEKQRTLTEREVGHA